MNDQRLLEMLRGPDRPVAPEPAFEESLYAALTKRSQRRRGASPATLLAAALLAALALGTAIFVGSQLLRDDLLVVAPDSTRQPDIGPSPGLSDLPDGYRAGGSVPFGF